MNPSTIGRPAVMLLCALFLVPASGVRAQSSTIPGQSAEPSSEPTQEKRLSFGIRLREFPVGGLSVLGDKQSLNTTYSPTRDWHFNTNSHSPSIGYGLGLEYVLSRKLILTGEVIFHRLKYEKVVNIYWGTDDSTTAGDERTSMERVESTKGRLWEVPILLHYGRLARTGVLSRLFISGGGAFRTITSIRTANSTSYSNGDSESDTTTTVPARRNIVGVVAGVGLRFIDDFNIRVMPEVRYTRWLGSMFGSDTTQSPRNQLEIGLGLYF